MPNDETLTYDDVAVLDLTSLQEAFGDLDAEIAATLGLFLSSTRPLLSELIASVAAKDWGAAAEAAHSAKGSANVAGALRLGAVCAEVDKALKLGDIALAERLAPSIPMLFAEVEAEIGRTLIRGC